MRAFRHSIALAAGAGLYCVTVVFVGGVLAAVDTPRGYVAHVGREQLAIALAVLSLVAWALPVAVLTAGGFLALHRFLAAPAQSVWQPALVGMLLSCLFWALVSAGDFSSGQPSQELLLQRLRDSFVPPWFGATNALAPWLGSAWAIWRIRRGQRSGSLSAA